MLLNIYFCAVLVSVVVCQSCAPLAGLNFIFVKGNVTSFDVVLLNDTAKLLTNPTYNYNKTTVIYCFGYTESYNSSGTQAVVQAYLNRSDTNILVADWSQYSGGNYFLDTIGNALKVNFLFQNDCQLKINIAGGSIVWTSCGCNGYTRF